jgi:ABC-type phosphate/phosphonate transport system substrate-binding protein
MGGRRLRRAGGSLVAVAIGFLLGSMVLIAPSSGADSFVSDEVLLVEPNGRWHIRQVGQADYTFWYGIRGDVPLFGDWDGDGYDTPGMYRPTNGFAYLTNELPPNGGFGVGDPALTFFFGGPGDQVFVGDWDGDRIDTLGISRNGKMYLANTNATVIADLEFWFGVPTDVAFGGDAARDGTDGVFLYRPTSGFTYFTNSTPVGPNDVAPTDGTLFFGVPTDRFVIGDWDADGVDSVGVFRPSNTTVYLRNLNTTGAHGISYVWGQPSWQPVAGVPPPQMTLILQSSSNGDAAAAGQVLANALHEATGASFSVVVATDQRHIYDLMCSSPATTVGLTGSLTYGLASSDCGVDAGLKPIRFGHDSFYTQFLVPRDSSLETIAGLDGMTWAVPSLTSSSGYVVPAGMLELAGATIPVAPIEAGSHAEAVLDVYDGTTDFATTFFSPPLLPEGEWQYGDLPDIPNAAVDSCAPTESGLFCGGYRVLDARGQGAVTSQAPDVIQQVRILDISQPIPNDPIAFGSQVPADLRTDIEAAFLGLSEETLTATVGSLYSWTGFTPAADSDWDWLRSVLSAAGFDAEDL